jgi:pyridoxamine 5'-phosphate oxidase
VRISIDLVTDTTLSVAEGLGGTLAHVDARDLDPDPLRQLAAWLDEAWARAIPNAEAVALATATPEGTPSVRMVLAKGIDDRGIAFFTNTESRKALELDANPRAALVAYWQPFDRQVRAEGVVERVAAEESAAYFETRPLGSRLAAWASPQSRVVADRAELERLYADAEARFDGADPPLPPHWGGYRLVPEVMELWQSRTNRLHDRIRFDRAGDGWRASRLAP